jgi:DNA-binding NtrC family response regulator
VETGREPRLPQTVLLLLVATLFGDPVSGRGEARRVARRLVELWSQSLQAVTTGEAVDQLLEAAPFLWSPELSRSRRALVARRRRGDQEELWVAGPAGRARRLLAVAGSHPELLALVEGPDCRKVWWGGGGRRDPRLLQAAGRWALAAAAWEEGEPSTREERLAWAESLYSLGRFERALQVLGDQRSLAARILRLHCQAQLQELRSARRGLRRLEKEEELSPEQVLDLAQTGVRVCANAGDRAGARHWAALALQAGRRGRRSEGRLVAALASWDLGDRGRMRRLLEAACDAAEDREVGWLYERVRSLESTSGVAAVRHLRRALILGRQRLRPFERGRLWNELAVARVLAGDLPGAERACRHAVRLLARCDGPLGKTLALPNLAEVRIRRGRLGGVAGILESSTRANERQGNVRGLLEDAGLWARYELARGRPERALEHVRAGLARAADADVGWKGDELRLLAARALGWLGRRGEAAAMLAAMTDEAELALEPEERPALWALAGLEESATSCARELGPLAPLWLGVLRQRPLGAGDWEAVQGLEPYRGARLVFDAELVSAGCAPSALLGTAIAALRRCDARPLADRLEAARLGPWQAVCTYLKRGGEEPAVAELFRDAGYGHVRLVWMGPDGEPGDDPWVAGPGGEQELSAPLGRGRLVLRAEVVDEVVRALFALVLRDVRPPSPEPRPAAISAVMVGSSPPLAEALERLARFAPQDVPVLILGETGTGKELAAREIHRLSSRRGRPFLAVNCAALSDSLLLSDLFGHARGSFTGADRDRAGVFEEARGGTVFLDEIGDLPLPAQGAFLRVLQEGEVRRVGESRPRVVDVRIVTATHRDLHSMVEAGTFREDLYYRLRVARLRLPPLRDRGLDILELADHFLASFGESSGGGVPRLTEAARRRLLGHAWPGNVRELRSLLEAAVAIRDPGTAIDEGHLDLTPTTPEEGVRASYHEMLEAYRRRLVAEALEAESGNQAAAARRLGLTRQALSYLVRQLDVAPRRQGH